MLEGGEMLNIPIIESGKGAYLFDNNSKEYIDFVSGSGAITIGHATTEITDEVNKQIRRGHLVSIGPHSLHHKLTSVLLDIYGKYAEVIYSRSGSEANSKAVRIAKAHTGKNKIIRCGFHGWHEWASQTFGTRHYTSRLGNGFIPPTKGISESYIRDNIITWSGDEIKILEEFLQIHNSDIACIIISPEEITEPIDEKLLKIRELTNEHNVLLIFDETKTAFHVNLGGVQKYYNIEPDITVISKGIANGFSLGATLLKGEFIPLINEVHISSTFQYELTPIVSALKTIEIMKREDTIGNMWSLGEEYIRTSNQIFETWGIKKYIEAEPWMWDTMPFIRFKDDSFLYNYAAQLYNYLHNHGILVSPTSMVFFSQSHKKEHIEEFGSVLEGFMRAYL